MNKLVSKIFIVGLIAVLASCNAKDNNPGVQFADNMYVSEPLDPLTQVEGREFKYNANNMTMREPVANTVARGKMPYRFAKDSFALAEATLKNPVELNDAVLKEGKDLYGKFCLHCHGETGQGDGLVGAKFKGVPKYNSAAIKDKKGGHIFHVITMGKGRMGAHASQLSEEERWKIVHYVHTLQKQ